MSTPRLKDVENPGSGNCGFYAFATGLIPVLQRELQDGNSERFNKLEAAIQQISAKHPEFTWHNLRNDILTYYPPSKAKEQKKKNPLLEKFNRVLREILAANKIQSIEDSLQKDSHIDSENRRHMTAASLLISDIQKELRAEGTREKFSLVSQCIQASKDLKKFEWDDFELDIRQFNPNNTIEKDRILTKLYHLLRLAEDTKELKTFHAQLMEAMKGQVPELLNNMMYQSFLPQTPPSIARLKSNEIMVEAVGMLDYFLGATSSDEAVHDAELMRHREIKNLIKSTAILIQAEEQLEVQRAKLVATTKSLLTNQKTQAVITPREEKIQLEKLDQKKENALSSREKDELSSLRKKRKADLKDAEKARLIALEQRKENALSLLEKNQYHQLQQKSFMTEERRYRRLKTYLMQASDEKEEVTNDVLSHSSVIHKVLSEILLDGVWATRGDLGALANFFDVSLVVYEDDNNQARQEGDLRPSVCVRNYKNGHWVTVFDQNDINQATLTLTENKKLTEIAAKVLAKDDETSGLLSKTLKTLRDNKIKYPTDFFMNEQKEDQEVSVNLILCRAINNLGYLQLLTQEWSFPMLVGDTELAGQIAKLSQRQLDKLDSLLAEAFDMGVNFKDTVEWLLRDPIGIEKHIQIACLEKNSADRKLPPGKHEGLVFWGYGVSEKRNAIGKVISHLKGENTLFSDIDISVIKNKDLATLLASLQIELRFGAALTPEQLAAAQPAFAQRKLSY